ncbi:hypothetical protein BJ684DRAFT_15308 [Piptocephalis cylindrospora]|uniref:Uncharacterized protein n=1 Tax=Piptocephalis cylindrospora TaxID=1907219 RepID=A0A4P9Y5T4_9FUNG|nr:hypothetical protein BJ684DRAFT_15308 [Piptocephalis cylindrospora]|eukprot:RKP14357.1 hypothetical protein BJ684DRAFT_15308 [Piptocephalis cylindrospora]
MSSSDFSFSRRSRSAFRNGALVLVVKNPRPTEDNHGIRGPFRIVNDGGDGFAVLIKHGKRYRFPWDRVREYIDLTLDDDDDNDDKTRTVRINERPKPWKRTLLPKMGPHGIIKRHPKKLTAAPQDIFERLEFPGEKGKGRASTPEPSMHDTLHEMDMVEEACIPTPKLPEGLQSGVLIPEEEPEHTFAQMESDEECYLSKDRPTQDYSPSL